MDIKDFKEKYQPSAQRSKLDSFEIQILELKRDGYTNKLIQEFLFLNDIKVTQNGIRMFIEKRTGKKIKDKNLIENFESIRIIKDQ
jgi:DNA-binding NarL/FixJ family response regulator